MSRLTKIVLPTFLVFLFLVEYLHPTNELYIDLGEHLLKGQLLFQTHQIPTTNLFSYTYPNYHFINLEWLAEAIFYLVNLFSGINGLIIFTTAVTLFSLAIIYKFTVSRSNVLLVSYLAVFYLVVLYERAAVLPEVFSYIFISIFVVLLYKFREKYTNFIWLLIPLQLLWINMHIYFIVGILLVGLFLIEAFVLFRARDNGRYTRILLLTFVSNCIASLVNPYGLNGLLYPFIFWQNYAFSVSENSSIFNILGTKSGSVSASVLVFGIFSIFIFLSILLQFKKVRLIDVLISLTFIVGGVIAVRSLGLFVFATFIPCTFLANSLLELYSKQEKKNVHTMLILFLPILCIALSGWVFTQLGKPGLGTVHGNEKAVDFFILNKLRGPIFNNYDIGSYLAYRLYPREKVFVDSRPEAYPADFIRQIYSPMLSNLSDFQAADKNFNFNSIIYGFNNGMPHDMGFLRYLIQSKEWSVVYIDDATIIFIKNVKSNESIIQKYMMGDDNFHPAYYASFDALYNLAHFLYLIGWKKSEIEVFQKMYEINPRNCEIIRNLIVLLGQNNTSAARYLINYRLYCNN